MDRDDLIQRTKEIAFSLNSLETPIISTIVQKSYPIENIVSERELYKIIDNVKRSGINIKSTMPLSELTATLLSSISSFKKSDWTKGKLLGEGAFGEVFVMTKGNEKIAFKELRHGSDDISKDSVRELGSYAILTAIGSKNIPQMIGFNTKGKFGFAMELADTDLWNWSKTATEQDKLANMPRIVDILLKSLSDIQSARLINADIKPQNMLIWLNGTEVYKAAITDFGLSSSFPDDVPYVYTEPWRDPDLKDGDPATFQTDCWAFAKSIADVCDSLSGYDPINPNDPSLHIYANTYFKQYLRPDQAVELTRMLEPKSDKRCIVSVRAVIPERNWDRIFDTAYDLTYWIAKIIKWLSLDINRGHMKNSTLAVSIDILYRYYNGVTKVKHIMEGDQTQLYGLASMYIAALWGEPLSYTFEELINIDSQTQKKFTQKTLSAAVYEIITKLNGLIWVPGLENVISTFDSMTHTDLKKMLRNENFYVKSLL